jgi:hypothetical protein
MLAAHDNVTLLTGAYVSRLDTDESGRRIATVRVTRDGREETYAADTLVDACGALCSALLLLRSLTDIRLNFCNSRTARFLRIGKVMPVPAFSEASIILRSASRTSTAVCASTRRWDFTWQREPSTTVSSNSDSTAFQPPRSTSSV